MLSQYISFKSLFGVNGQPSVHEVFTFELGRLLVQHKESFFLSFFQVTQVQSLTWRWRRENAELLVVPYPRGFNSVTLVGLGLSQESSLLAY